MYYSTKHRYGEQWCRWCQWATCNTISPTSPSLTIVLDFLGHLYNLGLVYRTINIARSTLSATPKPIDGFQIGTHPLVCRLMKGIYNRMPPVKKLVPTWSVKLVLDLLKSWSPATKLDMKCLTLKTVMLLALSTGKCCDSLSMVSVKSVKLKFVCNLMGWRNIQDQVFMGHQLSWRPT